MLTVAAIGLGYGMLSVDASVDWGSAALGPWLYSGRAEGARSLLGSLASSMITVTGTVFSITIVALSFASGHLGPRLLRTFTGDRSVQFVLGIFVATFLFCLTVLSGLRESQQSDFVPRLSISTALLLAVVSFVVLIYFIHHIARSLQVDNVVQEVRLQLERAIERMFPDRQERNAEPPAEPHWQPLNEEVLVSSQDSGYILAIDYQALAKRAQEYDLRIECCVRAGHFVGIGSSLLRVEGQLSEEQAAELRGSLGLAAQPTLAQDIEFSVRQLVEIALRALSPGVNDPFTAITCIDQLSSSCALFAERHAPERRFYPPADPRVAAPSVSFAELMDATWNQVRQHGAEQVAVAMRLLEAFERIAINSRTQEQLSVIRRHADMVAAACTKVCVEQSDLEDLRGRLESAHALASP